MKTLILVRHGQSEWNREGRIQGDTDCALSELGRRQAALLRGRLETERLDAAFASTATRALDTGRIALAHRFEIEAKDTLREINLGAWEGELVADLKRRFPRDTELWFTRPSRVAIDGAETLRSFRRRVTGELNGILEAADEDASVVVFAHGGVICSYLTGLLQLRLDDLWRFKIQNASITKVIFPVSRPRIAVLNDTSHLDGAMS
jgi:broad specificity phosphatase PhoE